MPKDTSHLRISTNQHKIETGTGNKKISPTQSIETVKCLVISAHTVWTVSPWHYIQFGIHDHLNNAH